MSLKFLSILKVKRVFAVVLSLNILIFSFSISSYAYSSQVDGLNRRLEWEWNGSYNQIESIHMEGGSSTLQLTASAFGSTARQNGGVNVSGTPLYETVNVANGNQNEVTIWVSGRTSGGMFNELKKTRFTCSTGVDDVYSTTRDFTFQVEFQTILHVEDEPNWVGGTAGDLSNLRLYYQGSQVYNLFPSYTLVEELGNLGDSNVSGGSSYTFYKVIAFFVVDNYDQETVKFDEIRMQVSCDINEPPDGYANRYRISIGNPELYEIAPDSVIDQVQAEQAGNDDLILKLGDINELDQAKINAGYENSSNSQSAVDRLDSAESNLNMDAENVDFSAPEIVLDGVEHSQNYWDIFFGLNNNFSSFLTQILTLSFLLISISLVLYGIKK